MRKAMESEVPDDVQWQEADYERACEQMIKIFEVTEVRTYRALVKVEVPDDVQWQEADCETCELEKAINAEVRQTEMKEDFFSSGTSYKESNVSVEEYDAGRPVPMRDEYGRWR